MDYEKWLNQAVDDFFVVKKRIERFFFLIIFSYMLLLITITVIFEKVIDSGLSFSIKIIIAFFMIIGLIFYHLIKRELHKPNIFLKMFINRRLKKDDINDLEKIIYFIEESESIDKDSTGNRAVIMPVRDVLLEFLKSKNLKKGQSQV